MARRGGADRLARVAGRVAHVFRVVEGIAGRQIPVAANLARHFRFHAAAALLALGDLAIAVAVVGQAGVGRTQVIDSFAVLFQLEDGQVGIELFIEKLALDTEFDIAAGDRRQRLAGLVEGALRGKHVGVAAVQAEVVIERIQGRHVGREFRVDAVGAGRVVRLVVPPAHARAEDDGERVAEIQARGRIRALLFGEVFDIGAGEGRHGGHGHVVRVPGVGIEAGHRRQAGQGGAGTGRRLRIVARAVDADHQLMLAAQQRERAAGVQVPAGLLGRVVLFAAAADLVIDLRRIARVARDQRLHIAVGAVHALHVDEVEAGLGAPAIAELVFQAGESLFVFAVPVVFRRAQIGIAREWHRAAVDIGQQVAPGAIGLQGRPFQARQHRGGRRDVRLDHRIQHAFVGLAGLLKMVAAVFHRHHAPAHAARGVQWRRHVSFGAEGIPAASGGRARGGKLRRGALAHQIDGARGAAGAAHQAGRAAQHFGVVEGRHVGLDIKAVAAARRDGGVAVELHVGDLLAARVVPHALRVGVEHFDAGRAAQHIGQVAQALVFDLLARDDGDAVRRFAQAGVIFTQRQGAAAVGAAAFAGAVARTDHADGGHGFIAGGVDLRRRRRAAQGIAAIGIAHRFQAAAGQQLRQGGVDTVAALQAAAGLAVGQLGAAGQQDAGLADKAGQRGTQGAGGNLVGAHGRSWLGVHRGRRQESTGNGQAHQVGRVGHG